MGVVIIGAAKRPALANQCFDLDLLFEKRLTPFSPSNLLTLSFDL
jgi:hypothetical protein